MRLSIAARQVAGRLLAAVVVAAFGLLVSSDVGSLLVLWWLDS